MEERRRNLEKQLRDLQNRNLSKPLELEARLKTNSARASLQCSFIHSSFTSLLTNWKDGKTSEHLKSLNELVGNIRNAIEMSKSLTMIKTDVDTPERNELADWKASVKVVKQSMTDFHQELMDSTMHRESTHETMIKIVVKFQEQVIQLPGPYDRRQDEPFMDHIREHVRLLKEFEVEAGKIIFDTHS